MKRLFKRAFGDPSAGHKDHVASFYTGKFFDENGKDCGPVHQFHLLRWHGDFKKSKLAAVASLLVLTAKRKVHRR